LTKFLSDFLSAAAKKLRDDAICNLQPFLYKLISSKLLANLSQLGDLDSDDDSNSEDEGSNCNYDSTSGDEDASSGILHSEGPEDSDVQIDKHVIQKQKYTKQAHVVLTFLLTPSPVLNKAHMSILFFFRLLQQHVQ
jgi:hypothetical protein